MKIYSKSMLSLIWIIASLVLATGFVAYSQTHKEITGYTSCFGGDFIPIKDLFPANAAPGSINPGGLCIGNEVDKTNIHLIYASWGLLGLVILVDIAVFLKRSTK